MFFYLGKILIRCSRNNSLLFKLHKGRTSCCSLANHFQTICQTAMQSTKVCHLRQCSTLILIDVTYEEHQHKKLNWGHIFHALFDWTCLQLHVNWAVGNLPSHQLIESSLSCTNTARHDIRKSNGRLQDGRLVYRSCCIWAGRTNLLVGCFSCWGMSTQSTAQAPSEWGLLTQKAKW